jgi:hypothetical protein
VGYGDPINLPRGCFGFRKKQLQLERQKFQMRPRGDLRNNPAITLMGLDAGDDPRAHNLSPIRNKGKGRFIARGFDTENQHNLQNTIL